MAVGSGSSRTSWRTTPPTGTAGSLTGGRDGTLGYLQRRLILRVILAVRPDPVSQRCLVDIEFSCHVLDSARGFHYQPGCLLPEVRGELPVFLCHLASSFPMET
jgi:hypothetical protein